MYSEKPFKSKSPEHILVPRLSSVEEFHEATLPSPTNIEETDHTPITMATTQDGLTMTAQDTNTEISTEPVTTTSSEVTHEAASVTVHFAELADNPVTINSNVSLATNEVTVSSELADHPVTINSSEVDVTLATNEVEETNNTTNNTTNTTTVNVTKEASPHVTIVDPGEVEIQVTINDSV